MEIIAYGPVPEDFPAVPDFVILQDAEGGLWMADREDRGGMSRDELEGLLRDGGARMVTPPREWRGGWYCVEEAGGATWFDPEGEKEWRRRRAQALLREAEGLRGDPVRKLSLLAAAGALEELDVPNLVSGLESRRRSRDETLVEIYRRVRSEQEPGD